MLRHGRDRSGGVVVGPRERRLLRVTRPDPARLRAVVESLASGPFAGRRVGTDGGRAAADHLAGVLRSAGAEVTYQELVVAGAVRELYGVPALSWSVGGARRDLAFRREFCEHLASADRPISVTGPVTRAATAGAWALHDTYFPDGAAAVAAAGAVGVLVPRGTDAVGWMPKMITGPRQATLPVLAVRRDLHELLRNATGATVTASVPLRAVDVRGRNVLGTFRRRQHDRPAFLLTAHYDGVGDDPAGDHARFPAACDNASGVAAVIEAARLLHAVLPPRIGLTVALLDAEEAGAHGSAAHAPTVAAGTHVINLDGAAALSGAHVEAGGPAEPLLAALDDAARQVGVPLRARAMPSDNRRYAAAGLATVGVGMGMPGYQTPLETPDRVETTTLVAATELLTGTVVRLAAETQPRPVAS
ncbi:M28 family metallopeptidase [Antribacter gilvus]|uniref:M28 family metallopeptidase n=1 Tax=Antribacter gilvus TaxID=2304675 RepID=UPI00197DB361|nr:M28 family peptidase [Antribacter gilvus]